MKKYIFILLLITLNFKLQTLNSLAQDFEVAPARLSFSVEPGGIGTKLITVRNHSNKRQAFILNLGDMVRDSLGKGKSLPAGTTKRSCADWITINPSLLELNPNETGDAEVMLRVPSDGYSTRWAMIYVKATQERTSVSADKVVATGILITPRIAISVFQSPRSNTKYKAMVHGLREVTTAQDSVRTFGINVENIGDKILECKIYLIVSNLETAKERKAKPVKVKLFPDESRIVTLTLPSGLAKGNYSLAAILDYGHRSNLEAMQMQIKVE